MLRPPLEVEVGHSEGCAGPHLKQVKSHNNYEMFLTQLNFSSYMWCYSPWFIPSDLQFSDDNITMVVLRHNSDPQLAICDTCSLLFWPIAAAFILFL